MLSPFSFLDESLIEITKFQNSRISMIKTNEMCTELADSILVPTQEALRTADAPELLAHFIHNLSERAGFPGAVE